MLSSRGRLTALDFEDVMWGWPIQDLGTTMYYLHLREDYEPLLAAFRLGYEEVRPWPDRTGSDLATFIAGRALVLGNDIGLLEATDSEQGIFYSDAVDWFDRAERRLDQLGI